MSSSSSQCLWAREQLHQTCFHTLILCLPIIHLFLHRKRPNLLSVLLAIRHQNHISTLPHPSGCSE